MPPPGVRDPMLVLEAILGAPVSRGEERRDMDAKLPELKDAEGIEFDGLSLEEFVRKAEAEEKKKPKVRKYSEQSVEEYEMEKDKFQDLHRSIKACDEVLKSVESYLSAFQTDLGTVSGEIESLQNRSMSLNRQLDNRKAVEKLLGPVVDDVVLPPNDVRRLIEGDVNDTWVKALHDTDRRIKAIEGKDPSKVKSVQEVQPELEKIKHKTVERVRDFFVSRIKALRVPGANSQLIQQQGFIRYKELFHFMAIHHPQLAEELAQAYTNTMRWYYSTHFQRYHKAFERLKLHVMDRNDVLGQEENARKGGSIIPGLKSAAAPAYDPFNIGRRIEILRNTTAPIMAAYQAEEDKITHYMEYHFRHFNAALVEKCATEYTFISDFFSHKKYDQMNHIFNQIFEPSFNLGKAFTKTLVDNTYDSLGILLCVRLNQYALFEMQKRRIPAAEGYLNGTNMLLWPRFQVVMDAHCESLRRNNNNTRMLSAMTGPAAKQSAAPHFLTQRFASLLHGLLSLSAEAGDDEPVQRSLARLRSDFEAFLTKLSSGIGDTRKRERFLFNNYSLILTIIGDTDGKLAMEQKNHFEALKKAFQE